MPEPPPDGPTFDPPLGLAGFDPIPSTPPGGGSSARGPIAPCEPPVKPAGREASNANLKPGVGPGKVLFAKGNTIASKGGKARAAQAALLRQIGGHPGSGGVPEYFKKYKGLAEGFRQQHVAELARDVGGGECGSGPALKVKFAAQQAAAAEWLYERAMRTENAEDFLRAMQLQNSSRQNLMAAHEMCAKQAQAKRKQQNPHNDFSKAFGT